MNENKDNKFNGKKIIKHEEIIIIQYPKTPPNRIRILRIINDLDIKELSSILNISPSMLQQIETQKKTINIELLLKISIFFNVSIDYILYNTYNPDANYNSIKETDVEILKEKYNKGVNNNDKS